jgi:predicted DCC family thiol-disulfide oxidoreductase YuxK
MTSLKTVFGCDLRALAVFRLGLGLSLFVDLASRARDLRAHYTYWGVVPGPVGPESTFLTFLHLFIGSGWFQVGVFLFAGLVALAVMVGFHTRLATLLAWFLLFFIQTRNNLVFQGGDKLLLLLLFWGIFLPLGARFSFDAALHDTSRNQPNNHFFSMGTVAILLQVSCLYFFSALLKNSPEWIPNGTAIYYALSLQSFVRPFGRWLLDFPLLTQWLTYYVWLLELVAPIFIFSPQGFGFMRLGMLGQILALHLGIMLCLDVGLFPLFNLVSLVPFLPACVWDRLVPSVEKKLGGRGLTIFFDNDCDFCRKLSGLLKSVFLLPHASLLPAQLYPQVFDLMQRENTWVVQDQNGLRYRRWDGILVLCRQSPIWWPLAHVLGLPSIRRAGGRLYRAIASHRGSLSELTRIALSPQPVALEKCSRRFAIEIWLGLLIVYMLFINLTTVPNLPVSLSDPFPVIQRTLGLNQNWDMFAPAPRPWDGWYVVPGQLIDGTIVDVYNRQVQAPSVGDSSLEQFPYSTYRWRKYLQNLTAQKYQDKRQHYADYLCRAWNESRHPLQHLLFLEIYFVKVDTPPPNSTPAQPEVLKLWRQFC